MGAENVGNKGIEINIPGDRPRIFNLGFKAEAWLAKKHGTVRKVYAKLDGVIDENGNTIEKEKNDWTSCQIEAMIDLLYAGLLRDSEKNGESLTREKLCDLLDDISISGFYSIMAKNQKEALPDSDPTKGQTKI